KNLSDEEYETYSFSIEGGSHPDRTELAAYDKLMSSLPLPVLENAKITWIYHQIGASSGSSEPYDIAAVSLDLGNDEWVRIEYLLSETDPDALAEKLSKNTKYRGAIYFMRIKSGNMEFLSEDYSEESGVKTLYGVYEGTVFRAVLKTENAKDLELDTFANDMVFGTLENYLNDAKVTDKSDRSSSTYIIDEPPASNSFLFDSYDDLAKALTEQDSSAVFGTDNYGELFDKTIAAFKNNTINLYVPAIDEDVSNITLMTAELYNLPWIWYHCKVDDNDVNVRIAYPGVIEKLDLSSAKTYYEVLKLIAPDAPNPDNYESYDSYQKIYESEISLANGKKVDAMISELKNNSKVYVMLNYEGMLVIVYADKSVLTASFWSSFTLAKY
ncbi:MAG: hypothetical protein J5864_00165, partial [Oscillospiraceae bacterium]|nr:hypothetical protein [Oscillospiraceae bacterium]